MTVAVDTGLEGRLLKDKATVGTHSSVQRGTSYPASVSTGFPSAKSPETDPRSLGNHHMETQSPGVACLRRSAEQSKTLHLAFEDRCCKQDWGGGGRLQPEDFSLQAEKMKVTVSFLCCNLRGWRHEWQTFD